jgi:hypothetical protein
MLLETGSNVGSKLTKSLDRECDAGAPVETERDVDSLAKQIVPPVASGAKVTVRHGPVV